MMDASSAQEPNADARSTRDRLLGEAVRLFAERGYAATSVADIQTACGLAAGSGALYKHFRSKRALLEAIVERHLTTMAEGEAGFLAARPDDPGRALEWLVEQVWAALEHDREPLRVLLRDLDAFPELAERLWQGVLGFVYRALAGWLAAEQDAGRLRVADPEATAAVLLASLTGYRILDALLGRVPGDVPAARFATAWLAHARASLGLS